MQRLGLSAALAGLLLLGAPRATATVADPRFVETKLGMLRSLTSMAWAPDGSDRLFLTTKLGEIRILQGGQLLPEPVATLSPIFTTSECGLLGLAFDPDFLDNGYFYVFVSVSATEQQIVRFTLQGNVAKDKTPIVVGLPTKGRNHDGGALGFGPDGKLYWAIGDNGLSPRLGVDNDLLTLGTKVGRANVDGTAPKDNPFYDGDGPHNDYIWARGFRNPFSLTFQPTTGRLWLNVVGSKSEQIFTPQAGDNGGWDNYEVTQPAGFLEPVIAYDTDTALARTVAPAGAVRAGGVVTITTTAPHKLRPGASVTIAGVTNASFDTKTSITSATASTFTYAQPGPDATSGGGTATPDKLGGCVVGGTFWDSSAGPADYAGSFFWADYNGADVLRATLDQKNQVTKIEHFSDGNVRLVDTAMGPDGNLYYGSYTGALFRASFTADAEGLVVSQLNVRMNEGGRAAFGVRLAMAPVAPRTVQVAFASGDSDVSISEGTTLSFDAMNWSTPQRVVVSAAFDADTSDDHATVQVSSSKLPSVNVNVNVTDVGSHPGMPGAGGAGAGGESASAGGESASIGGEPSSSLGGNAAGGDVSLPEAGKGEAGLPSMGGSDDVTGAGGAGATAPSGGSDSGCGCRSAGGGSSPHWLGLVALGLLRAGTRHRSRRQSRASRDPRTRKEPRSRS